MEWELGHSGVHLNSGRHCSCIMNWIIHEGINYLAVVPDYPLLYITVIDVSIWQRLQLASRMSTIVLSIAVLRDHELWRILFWVRILACLSPEMKDIILVNDLFLKNHLYQFVLKIVLVYLLQFQMYKFSTFRFKNANNNWRNVNFALKSTHNPNTLFSLPFSSTRQPRIFLLVQFIWYFSTLLLYENLIT